MTPFKDIIAEAARRRGGAAALKNMMPEVNSAKALKNLSDGRYFSRMSFRVFASGLRHSMVEKNGLTLKMSSWVLSPAACAP